MAELLQSTGVAGRPEEYFRPDWQWQYAWTGGLEFQHLLDHWEPARPKGLACPPGDGFDYEGFVAAIRGIAATDNGVLGVKLHWRHLEQVVGSSACSTLETLAGQEAALRSWFPNPRYVLLTRRDRLRQAISYHRAIESDEWWTTGRPSPRRATTEPAVSDGAGTAEPTGERELDLGQVEQLRLILLGHEQRWHELFSAAGVAPLELVYEDVVADPPKAVAAVLGHLGVAAPEERAQPKARLRRQADDLTERTVERYREWRRQALPAPWSRAAAPAGEPVRCSMRTGTVIVENFYADPDAVRGYALVQEYYYPYERQDQVEGGKQAFTWMASRFKRADDCPFKSSDELIRQFERITGEEVDLDHWRADFPVGSDGRPRFDYRSTLDRSCLWNCSFHCKPDNGQQLGNGVHNHVIDGWNGVDIHGWAGIVYLSPDAPTSGGLKLWRNRSREHQFDWMSPADHWDLIDDLGNVPNRLILVRGNLPHSGAAGWGSSLTSGRLYQTFFFKTRSPVLGRGLEIPL
ncbi:MAG: Stf0 family sulfotransferase [Actinomycetota bacterium]|nr:Stf0 family sulfotransferase [Actinomycetota bacterium]